MGERQTAVVVGVGPGLGWALVRRFSDAGMGVAMAARSEERLQRLLAAEPRERVRAYACDATDGGDVAGLFERVRGELGEPDLVVFNAGTFEPGGVLDIDSADFERCWRVMCLGGFHVGQAAARGMVARAGGGTIVFTGATAALRGGANFANLAVPKFGLRALAQSMARELGPRGIHVAHVVIDGEIGSAADDSRLEPAAIAEAYYQLHRQHRSAWAHELDLRPWREKF